MSVSRVYANVNEERAKSYWEYEAFNPTWQYVQLSPPTPPAS